MPANERASLEACLEFHRATLLLKCDGLSAAQLATRSCPPSGLTLLGLVRHLIGVEDWFHRFDDEPEMDPYPDGDGFMPHLEHVDRDLASHRSAGARRSTGAPRASASAIRASSPQEG